MKEDKKKEETQKTDQGIGQELLCMVGLHNWTKWEKIAEGNITEYGEAIGYYVRQRRNCTCCGVIKMKDRKTY
jgi:hypothetical protein